MQEMYDVHAQFANFVHKLRTIVLYISITINKLTTGMDAARRWAPAHSLKQGISMKSKLRHSIASVLIVSVLNAGLPVHAEIVGTEASADRERIAAILDREEVRARLAAYGVDPADAKARVAALTDEEAIRLAAEMDTLPAGGNALVLLLPVLGIVVYLVAWIICSVVSDEPCE